MFKIPKEIENKYAFVTLAAKRAEQLQMGALPRLESASEKYTVIAQEEVATGKVGLFDPEQAAEDLEMEEEE